LNEKRNDEFNLLHEIVTNLSVSEAKMTNPYQTPGTDPSVREKEEVRNAGPFHLGKTLAGLTFLEFFFAMLLAPPDNGRTLGYDLSVIVFVNGLLYLFVYLPKRFRLGRDPGISVWTLFFYLFLAVAAVIVTNYCLHSRSY